MIFVTLALLALLKTPELGETAVKGKLLEIILNCTITCLVILKSRNIIGKNYSVMIWLICDSLPFYAQVHTCSSSYTDEE